MAGDNVKVGATEILAGRVPQGGTARLARTVGESKAKDLVFSGRFIDAKEALALGLIDEMVAPDGVYDAARGLGERFVEYPPRYWLPPRPPSPANLPLGCPVMSIRGNRYCR